MNDTSQYEKITHYQGEKGDTWKLWLGLYNVVPAQLPEPSGSSISKRLQIHGTVWSKQLYAFRTNLSREWSVEHGWK